MIAVLISALTGVDSDRFGQVHTVFYSVGIGLFVIFFIVEKTTTFFSKLMGKLFCCGLKRDEEEMTFSSDIYKDISSEAQRKEYFEAKQLRSQVSTAIKKDEHSEFSSLREYYKQRLILKVISIRFQLKCALTLAKAVPGTLRDTKSAFFSLEKKENKEATSELFVERMHGLYSYNVFDSPEFKQAKKIERRIATYDKKMRQRMKVQNDKIRATALTSAAAAQAGTFLSGAQSPTNQSLSQALKSQGVDENREIM